MAKIPNEADTNTKLVPEAWGVGWTWPEKDDVFKKNWQYCHDDKSIRYNWFSNFYYIWSSPVVGFLHYRIQYTWISTYYVSKLKVVSYTDTHTSVYSIWSKVVNFEGNHVDVRKFAEALYKYVYVFDLPMSLEFIRNFKFFKYS